MADHEFSGKYAPKKKEPLKPWYPVIGLVLIGIAGAVGFFARVEAYAFIQRQFLAGRGGLPPDETMQWIVALGIFLVIIGIFSVVFAVFQPRPKSRKITNEAALKQHKAELNRERQRAKRRKAQMKQKMRKASRSKSQ